MSAFWSSGIGTSVISTLQSAATYAGAKTAATAAGGGAYSATKKVSPKLAGCLVVGTIGAVAAPVAIPAAAAAIGFGTGGIAAGSTAASMMSAAWTSGYGVGAIATLQSIGAAGVGAKTVAATGAVAYKVTSMALRK
ncbi:hypothetical protein ACOMHN_051420 [Nucella lapillus]